MGQPQIGNRWWEAITIVLAINSIVFGFLFGSELVWAFAVGFVPGVLLLFGLGIRRENRGLATVLITMASVAAAFAFWMIYPVVLALVVIIGGFSIGKIGPRRPETAVA